MIRSPCDKGIAEIMWVNNVMYKKMNSDKCHGTIKSIIVAQTGKIIKSLTGKNTMEIPWDRVKVIGEDVILVDIWLKR